jgi:hypothetical protein
MPRKTKAPIQTTPQPEQPAPTLSQLCSQAAEHVARARLALFEEDADAEGALAHLDDAIDCLKRLLAHGRPSRLNGSSTLRSA